MVAISSYFTIARAAEILDEDEEWLHELSIDMFAEDGCVTIYGVGEESITAFSDFGIENLRETISKRDPQVTRRPKVNQNLQPETRRSGNLLAAALTGYRSAGGIT